MPAVSKSQQRLMQAALHNAQFPKAEQVRASMTKGQMRDFAVGSEKGKPQRVAKVKPVTVRPANLSTPTAKVTVVPAPSSYAMRLRAKG